MKTTNEQTTPAPVWRLLEPGEIIREEDECYCRNDSKWEPCTSSIGLIIEPEILGDVPVRRRMEPDPVKAELLAALELLQRIDSKWNPETGARLERIIGTSTCNAIHSLIARANSTT